MGFRGEDLGSTREGCWDPGQERLVLKEFLLQQAIGYPSCQCCTFEGILSDRWVLQLERSTAGSTLDAFLP